MNDSTNHIALSAAGRRHGVSPSAVTRWVMRGAKLRDGSRLKLRAIRLPQGFRTTELWLDEFIDALTRDRTGAAVLPESVEDRARTSEMQLQAAGW